VTTPSDAEPPFDPLASARPPSAPPPASPASSPASSSPEAVDQRPTPPLFAALITTILVTAASYLTPDRYAATVVGVLFLLATWWLVLRHDELTVRAYGLSLGGVLEPVKIDVARGARDAAIAIGWAVLFMAITFPPFWLSYRFWWHPRHAFVLRLAPSMFDEIAGQLVVIALPEEAFFRGYLQTSLDRAWRPRWRVLGAEVGPGLLVSAAIFAIGHVLTIRHPARLAVFFPALLFGWMRARTRGIGASVLFHASCNLFSATLGRGYGLL
jgi:uncharacterized protein